MATTTTSALTDNINDIDDDNGDAGSYYGDM